MIPSGRPGADRRGLLVFLAVATALVGLLFSDAWVHGHVLSQADILFIHAPWSAHRPAGFEQPGNALLADVPTVFYPFLIHTADSLRGGRLPVWCAALFGGHPFLASFQSATFSPFTLPSLLLGPADALLAAAIAKLLVGAAGMWLLLRRLGLSTGAIWFGATAYLLNPFSVVWAEHPVSAVSAWLPLLLWSTDRLVASRARRDVALLSAVAGVVILAGHPETSYKVLLLAAVYGAVGTWYESRAAGGSTGAAKAAARAIATRFVPAAGLALLVSSIQVVPFAEYLLTSQAWQMRHETATNIYPAPAATVISATLVPNFFGNPSKGNYFIHYNRHGTASNFCEQQMYPGLATWLLAIAGLLAWRTRWRAWTWAASAVVGAALMFGVPGITDAFLLVPGAAVIVLTRFGLVAIVAAIVLGAVGVDALAREPLDPRARTLVRSVKVAALVMAILVAVGLVAAWGTLVSAGLAAQSLAWSAWSLGLVAATTVAIAARARQRISGLGFVATAVVLVAIDLLALGWRYHPMVARDRVFPEVPEIAFVQGDRGLFRVAGLSSALVPNAAMAYGLQDLRGYDGVTPGLHADLAGTAHKGGSYRMVRPGDPFHVLDLMNVKYLFAPAGASLPADHFTRVFSAGAEVYRNERAFPRAFLVSRARAVDRREALRLIRAQAIDLRHEVLLETALAENERPEASPAGAEGDTRIARYEDALVEIDTDAAGRRVLVLGDLDYPGWTVTVDDAPARLLRANAALRAVALPAGRHRVSFRFDPASVRAGAWLTLAGLSVAAALASWPARRRRVTG